MEHTGQKYHVSHCDLLGHSKNDLIILREERTCFIRRIIGLVNLCLSVRVSVEKDPLAANALKGQRSLIVFQLQSSSRGQAKRRSKKHRLKNSWAK